MKHKDLAPIYPHISAFVAEKSWCDCGCPDCKGLHEGLFVISSWPEISWFEHMTAFFANN